jgi:single-strand DNA-binding protein
MDLNRATIIGRLTRDIELRNLPSGNSVASFSLATNRRWTSKEGQAQEQTEFHNIVLWGKIAEIANQYLKKGARVYIEGRLQTRDWTGQDGVKRYRTEIIGENMIMLDGRNSGGSNNPQYIEDNGGAQGSSEHTEEEIKVEDIPF